MQPKTKSQVKQIILEYLFNKSHNWLRINRNSIIEQIGNKCTAYRYRGIRFVYEPLVQGLTFTCATPDKLKPKAEDIYQFYVEHRETKLTVDAYITNALNACIDMDDIIHVFPAEISRELQKIYISYALPPSERITRFREEHQTQEALINMLLVKNLII